MVWKPARIGAGIDFGYKSIKFCESIRVKNKNPTRNMLNLRIKDFQTNQF